MQQGLFPVKKILWQTRMNTADLKPGRE